MADEIKTPQQIAIDDLVKDLDTLENILNSLSSTKYRYPAEKARIEKYVKMMRKVINEKAAELQRVQNHYNPIPAIDAREEYIKTLETKINDLEKRLNNK